MEARAGVRELDTIVVRLVPDTQVPEVLGSLEVTSARRAIRGGGRRYFGHDVVEELEGDSSGWRVGDGDVEVADCIRHFARLSESFFDCFESKLRERVLAFVRRTAYTKPFVPKYNSIPASSLGNNFRRNPFSGGSRMDPSDPRDPSLLTYLRTSEQDRRLNPLRIPLAQRHLSPTSPHSPDPYTADSRFFFFFFFSPSSTARPFASPFISDVLRFFDFFPDSSDVSASALTPTSEARFATFAWDPSAQSNELSNELVQE